MWKRSQRIDNTIARSDRENDVIYIIEVAFCKVRMVCQPKRNGCTGRGTQETTTTKSTPCASELDIRATDVSWAATMPTFFNVDTSSNHMLTKENGSLTSYSYENREQKRVIDYMGEVMSL